MGRGHPSSTVVPLPSTAPGPSTWKPGHLGSDPPPAVDLVLHLPGAPHNPVSTCVLILNVTLYLIICFIVLHEFGGEGGTAACMQPAV